MLLASLTTSSDSAAVTAAAAAIGGTLLRGQWYRLISTTNLWVAQGTSVTITCVAKASLADTDFFTSVGPGIGGNAGTTIPSGAFAYEFDKAGDGVTAGRVRVNVSTDTTAAQVAARLRTAMLANQAYLTITDNADGTLTVVAPSLHVSFTENVANAGFTIAATTTYPVTAADGSQLWTANVPLDLNGDQGPHVAVIRNTADGTASLTKARAY